MGNFDFINCEYCKKCYMKEEEKFTEIERETNIDASYNPKFKNTVDTNQEKLGASNIPTLRDMKDNNKNHREKEIDYQANQEGSRNDDYNGNQNNINDGDFVEDSSYLNDENSNKNKKSENNEEGEQNNEEREEE